MLIIMAVNTEVFPIAAIFGVVVVIAVPVVDGQQMQIVTFKLTSTFGADPTMQLERLFAIVGVGRLVI